MGTDRGVGADPGAGGQPRGPQLTDGVVLLRPPTRDDHAALLGAIRSSREHLWPWMAWATEDYGAAEATAFLDEVEAGRERAFLVLDEDGRLEGECGLSRVNEVHRTASLGYWLRARATGRGLATRAARLVLVHGLEDLGLERIEILVAEGNTASRRVAERLDLDYEGVRPRAVRIDGEQGDAEVFVAFRADLGRLRDALD